MRYEDVCLHDYADGLEADRGLDADFQFYNGERLRQALDYRTPEQVYRQTRAPINDAVPP